MAEEAIGEFSLLERLPSCPPLSLPELRLLAKAQLGLRSTSPSGVADECQKGVVGDYIVLSDLSHLVPIDNRTIEQFLHALGYGNLQNFQMERFARELLAQAAITGTMTGKMTELAQRIDLSSVPVAFETALFNFLAKRAIPAIGYQLRDDMRLEQYLTSLMDKVSPALMLVQADDRRGYDHDRYFGFPKMGRAYIRPSQLLQVISIGLLDVGLLRRRYQAYLDTVLNLHPSSIADPSYQLIEQLDVDIGKMLHTHTIGAIRTVLNQDK